MRSTSGLYYQKLDHLRALAAFMVYSWHFTHSREIVPYDFVPANPIFSLFEEGHFGVTLFMALSGYLFAKLIDDREISFAPFLWNRFIRLAPLLLIVLLITYARDIYKGSPPLEVIKHFVAGAVFPLWPNGGWSLAVEAHFYILLPLLLVTMRRLPSTGLWFIGVMITVRLMLFLWQGEVQDAAYWTIVGRIDQFILGMFTFYTARNFRFSIVSFLLAAVALITYSHLVNIAGGFYDLDGYPSKSSLWVIRPTIEGGLAALLIVSYDRMTACPPNWVSEPLALIGKVSYSIYLVHAFFVSKLAAKISAASELTSYPAMLALSVATFVALLPIFWISWRLIELPPMKYRKQYLLAHTSRTAVA